jgi:moderate conductance mechanosensitive channel
MQDIWAYLVDDWPLVVVALSVALAAAYALAEILARLANRALVATVGADDPVGEKSAYVRRPVRIIRVVVFLLGTALLAFPAMQIAGAPLAVGIDPELLGAWLLGSGLRIVLIVLLTYALFRILTIATRRMEREMARGTGADLLERSKRAKTLGGLVQNLFIVVLAGVAVLMVLRELRVDIMPMLTGAGILGLAIGFGAQTLVRDVISGFFLILEDQVRAGDVAQINGTGGFVEAINLRTIVLRDLEGVVHVFPNGAIERLANRTKDFSYFVIDVGVAYKEDTDHVVAVLEEIGDGLVKEEKWAQSILAPLEILGVDNFGDSEVTIKVRIKTLPLKQWDVGRELRRRIKKTFDARGIEIPFPHVSVYLGSQSRPFVEQQRGQSL